MCICYRNWMANDCSESKFFLKRTTCHLARRQLTRKNKEEEKPNTMHTTNLIFIALIYF